MASDAAIVEGTLERVVFQNPSTQWTVARLIPSQGGAPITVVGALLGLQPGLPLILRGTWVDDSRYGRQFRVASYQTRSPETLLGIERYLGSGLIPGIGAELAKRIVAAFGLRTLEVIEEEPGRLEEVEGIGRARAASIAEAWQAQRDIQDVMVFLRGHGVSPAYAARIYKRYGQDAMGLVRENPYRLALDIWGIGFKTADGIARSLGIEKSAPARLEAGLVHVLGELAEDGHAHAPEDALIARTAELLEVDVEPLTPALERLESSGLIMREPLGDRGQCASLIALWEQERDAAAALARLAETPMPASELDVESALAWFEEREGIELAPEQRRAIRAAALDKCVVITGGPGVGKTTIVRAITAIFAAKQRRVALCAPTGRAAKRLSESAGAPALTLHRLLEFQPRTASFERNASRPLEVDVVIVDEASMIDIGLARALLVALPPAAQLILVGDIDQLPSVGPGSVLADVIASEAATVVELREIFRQAAQSQIVVAAHRINRGELPELAPPSGDDPTRTDFYFVGRDDPRAARDTLIELVAERIPQRFGFDAVAEIQVLAPMHRGDLGTAALNAALQARLNPSGAMPFPEVSRGDRVFRAGDKVMQIRNDYDREVFNGDMGIVRAIEREPELVRVELFDGRVTEYRRDDLDQLVHAYAVSVHKSQGSEYPAVVLPLMMQHYMMLQRTLLYTAVTRGKQLVVVVGQARAVQMAVRQSAAKHRFTYLAERIRQGLDGGA
jgi:exodeoxyribonuclease V alpha subunit